MILMPEALTAENGAKAALIGEFYETYKIECSECNGAGFHYDEDDLEVTCPACKGDGVLRPRIPVEWTTIKDIYKRAVALLGQSQSDAIAEAVAAEREKNDALICSLAAGYERMSRALCNMAATSGPDASWYRREMIQNTEQNVRALHEQDGQVQEMHADMVKAVCGRRSDYPEDVFRAYLKRHIVLAEARGAAGAVLKMAFSTEQKAIEELKDGKRGEAFWRVCLINALTNPEGWDNEEAQSHIDLLISEFKDAAAEEQRRKDAEGCERWEFEEPEYHDQGMGCGLEDRGIHDRYQAMEYGWDQAIERCVERIPEELYTRPANVAALEAEIASLKEAEQLARADAEASKARVKVLEEALDHSCRCMSDSIEGLKAISRGHIVQIWLRDEIQKIRAALTREGGV